MASVSLSRYKRDELAISFDKLVQNYWKASPEGDISELKRELANELLPTILYSEEEWKLLKPVLANERLCNAVAGRERYTLGLQDGTSERAIHGASFNLGPEPNLPQPYEINYGSVHLPCSHPRYVELARYIHNATCIEAVINRATREFTRIINKCRTVQQVLYFCPELRHVMPEYLVKTLGNTVCKTPPAGFKVDAESLDLLQDVIAKSLMLRDLDVPIENYKT